MGFCCRNYRKVIFMKKLDFQNGKFTSTVGKVEFVTKVGENYLFKSRKSHFLVDEFGRNSISGKDVVRNLIEVDGIGKVGRGMRTGRTAQLEACLNKSVYVVQSVNPFIRCGTLLGKTKNGTFTIFLHNESKTTKAIATNIFLNKEEVREHYLQMSAKYRELLTGNESWKASTEININA